MADEVVNLQSTGTTKFHASVFNAMPAATVTWRMPDDAEWQDMQRVVEPDLLLLERWREGQPNQETLPWRNLHDPMPSAQLWQATFPEKGLARNLRR